MAEVKVLCVIPARYASTRLPGKPLALIGGKPMIQHVCEQAAKSRLSREVLVATDDERVVGAVSAFGGKALLTSPDHPSGTDRLAEVARKYPDADIIINVQGDEPFIPPEIIDQLAAALLDEPQLKMATVKIPLKEDEFANPAAVKVVTDKNGYALYFSRSMLPYPRVRGEKFSSFKHLGIYAYRRDFLLEFAQMPQTELEQTECLEQLRALENGYKIKVIAADFFCVGVDTPEDLAHANKLFAESCNK